MIEVIMLTAVLVIMAVWTIIDGYMKGSIQFKAFVGIFAVFLFGAVLVSFEAMPEVSVSAVLIAALGMIYGLVTFFEGVSYSIRFKTKRG
jgi:hypothetical protein